MSRFNPFGRLGSGNQQTPDIRGRRSLADDGPVSGRWQDNFQPFSEDTGQSHEAFLGRRRVRVMQAVLLGVMLILLGRLVELKVVRGEDLRQQASTNFRRYTSIAASRGIIFDRQGEKLVTNEPDYQLFVLPPSVDQEAAELHDWIRHWLGLEDDELLPDIEQAITRNQPKVLIPVDVQREQAIEFLTNPNRLAALNVEIGSQREYAFGPELSHVLGYMTEIYQEELTADESNYYAPGDKVGREGIERQYEGLLRGVKGKAEVEVDAVGRAITIRNDEDQAPKSGHNLVLTIDHALQTKVSETLAAAIEKHQAKAGVAIVMDPNTGEVLSLVSLPSYDNNWFTDFLTQAEYQQLYGEGTGQPLFNRAIAGLYPPASTFKMFVAAGALEEGTLTSNTRLNNPGYLDVGGSRFVDWIWNRSGGSFGVLDVTDALAVSSDVFMYQIGAGYNDQVGLGANRIKLYANRFGLGEKTEIDLPGELVGSVTSEADFEAAGRDWYWGNTAHMSIGQGYSLVTPLELLVGIAAIANGGDVVVPHLVKRVEATSYAAGYEVEPVIRRQDIVSPQTMAVIQQGMWEVVYGARGTGRSLQDLPVTVAGKTGTAQHDKSKQDHAWFVSYAPYENPALATVVLLEQGGEGSAAAAPVTKEILKWYFENRT